ncbi:hypothetical protein [Persicitalea sp.]|uniref:hypothetical protein n=1 Tax=Persicitalea sp. TaxID=3100273 RepID=UPI003594677B
MEAACRKYLAHALQHESPDGVGWLLQRRDYQTVGWLPRPHWIWQEGAHDAIAEIRDDDPDREKIMLGSWFYPLSIALVSHLLGDTGYEGPYHYNPDSLHVCNVFDQSLKQSL